MEVHLSNGLPRLSIADLPRPSVKETKDRVRAALLNARFEFPMRRITINLAPRRPAQGRRRFAQPIALPAARLGEYEFIGELT